jgi:hypothetical protein
MVLTLSVKEVSSIISCIDNAYGDSGATYQDLELGVKLMRMLLAETTDTEKIRWWVWSIEKYLMLIDQAKMREIENNPLV